MTKLTTSSKRIRLAAVLTAGIALIAMENIASANNQRHTNDGASMSSDHSVNGMTQNNRHKHKKIKSIRNAKPVTTTTPTKNCLYITSDGKRCG